jgi:hypothetical protein
MHLLLQAVDMLDEPGGNRRAFRFAFASAQ